MLRLNFASTKQLLSPPDGKHHIVHSAAKSAILEHQLLSAELLLALYGYKSFQYFYKMVPVTSMERLSFQKSNLPCIIYRRIVPTIFDAPINLVSCQQLGSYQEDHKDRSQDHTV